MTDESVCIVNVDDPPVKDHNRMIAGSMRSPEEFDETGRYRGPRCQSCNCWAYDQDSLLTAFRTINLCLNCYEQGILWMAQQALKARQ